MIVIFFSYYEGITSIMGVEVISNRQKKYNSHSLKYMIQVPKFIKFSKSLKKLDDVTVIAKIWSMRG